MSASLLRSDKFWLLHNQVCFVDQLLLGAVLRVQLREVPNTGHQCLHWAWLVWLGKHGTLQVSDGRVNVFLLWALQDMKQRRSVHRSKLHLLQLLLDICALDCKVLTTHIVCIEVLLASQVFHYIVHPFRQRLPWRSGIEAEPCWGWNPMHLFWEKAVDEFGQLLVLISVWDYLHLTIEFVIEVCVGRRSWCFICFISLHRLGRIWLFKALLLPIRLNNESFARITSFHNICKVVLRLILCLHGLVLHECSRLKTLVASYAHALFIWPNVFLCIHVEISAFKRKDVAFCCGWYHRKLVLLQYLREGFWLVLELLLVQVYLLARFILGAANYFWS